VTALRGVDFRARLAAIGQPVMIVNGSKDKMFVDQEASFMAVARQATSHRFDNCEHGVSIRRSADFAALINGLAERVFAATPASMHGH
jgi:pimeloyl-ACP methyl ester carboxylesterase